MNDKIIKTIEKDGLVVMATDTIYGIVGSALNPVVVERIYEAKKRSQDKPFIILISRLEQLSQFKIKLKFAERKFLEKVWPGAVSVILDCPNSEFSYLHRDGQSLAFRLPDNKNLQKIIDRVGPIVATSVNPEGKPFAKNISEAKDYFGDLISFYVDAGPLESTPSAIYCFKNSKPKKIR